MSVDHPEEDGNPEFGARVQSVQASHGAMLAVQFEGVQYNYFFGIDRPSSTAPSLVVPRRRVAADRLRGRAKLIETQLAWLPRKKWATSESRRVRVLHGLGGSGKTTVALEIAHLVAEDYKRTWWVRADDRTALIAALHAVAYQVGATDQEMAHGNPADVLWRKLDDLEEPWLLVLDNADDPAILALGHGSLQAGTGWLRPPGSDLGRVLITSREGRSERWAPWISLHLVAALDPVQGAEVLLDRAPQAGTKQEAELLAARLGGLPLALDIAGSYLAAATSTVWPDPSVPDTFDKYRITLDVQVAELTTDRTANPDDFARRTIMSTWELSLEMLADQGHWFARPFLRLLACLGPSPIPYVAMFDPRSIIRSPLFHGADSHRFAEMLAALEGLGLAVLTVDENEDENFRRLVDLHPLVRDINRHQTDVTDRLADYIDLVTICLNDATSALAPEISENWSRWALLAPHCAAIMTLLRQLPSQPAPERALSATTPAFSAALYRWATGLYSAAESELRAILDVLQCVLADDHPQTLRIRHALALTIRDQGRYDEAESEFRIVFNGRRRVLGDDASETLTSRHALALTFRDEGRYEEAEAELHLLLTASQNAFGEADPQTLQVRDSHASALYALGHFDLAESEYQTALNLMRVNLGESDPRTLRARHGLALTLRDQHRNEAAGIEFRAVFERYRRILGENHPQTLRSRYNLSTVLHAQGQYEEAEREYREILHIQRGVLGEDHPYTLRTRHNLGAVLRDMRRYEDAEEELAAVLAIQSRVLGSHHHYTLRTRFTLATVVAIRNPHAVGEDLRSILNEQQRVLGGGHPETRATAEMLSEVVENLKTFGGYHDGEGH